MKPERTKKSGFERMIFRTSLFPQTYNCKPYSPVQVHGLPTTLDQSLLAFQLEQMAPKDHNQTTTPCGSNLVLTLADEIFNYVTSSLKEAFQGNYWAM